MGCDEILENIGKGFGTLSFNLKKEDVKAFEYIKEIIYEFDSYYCYKYEHQEKVYEIFKKINDNQTKNLDLCK